MDKKEDPKNVQKSIIGSLIITGLILLLFVIFFIGPQFLSKKVEKKENLIKRKIDTVSYDSGRLFLENSNIPTEVIVLVEDGSQIVEIRKYHLEIKKVRGPTYYSLNLDKDVWDEFLQIMTIHGDVIGYCFSDSNCQVWIF